MKKKHQTPAEAVLPITDGAKIMVGGFGSPGTPFCLIQALLENGAKHLTIIKNDANEDGIGIDHLIENDRVDRLITTHLGLNRHAIERMHAGVLEVDFVPQGIFAERIRCCGVGLPAILSDIGLDTELALSGTCVEVEGERFKVEPAIKADFALVHAKRADVYGNLCYQATAQNFNPLMAMAADHVIAEIATAAETTALPPEHVHTPGVFVDALVHLPGWSGWTQSPDLQAAYQLRA